MAQTEGLGTSVLELEQESVHGTAILLAKIKKCVFMHTQTRGHGKPSIGPVAALTAYQLDLPVLTR